MEKRKFGKNIDQRYLKRDFKKIKEMVDTIKVFCQENLEPFDNSKGYVCRVCNSKTHTPFVNIWGYYYNLCAECNSVVLLNIPNARKLYDAEHSAASNHFLDEDVFVKRVQTIALPKVQFIFEAIEQDLKTDKNKKYLWCDIGCGVGEILMALKNYNPSCESIGIDIDPREIEFGKGKGLNIIKGFVPPPRMTNDSESITDIIKQSDVVSMFNVLEHLEHPNEMIDYVKLMKKGAYLIIEVPKHPSLASFVNLISPAFTYRHILPPIHFQVFSEKSIERLIGHEFLLLANWEFGQGFTDIITAAMILGGIEEQSLYQQLMDISNDVQNVIDKNRLGDVMLYVLKRL